MCRQSEEPLHDTILPASPVSARISAITNVESKPSRVNHMRNHGFCGFSVGY